MLKINRLTGLEGKTGPETAGPVNRAVIQCLHITAPAHKFRYRLRKFSLILHAKANKHLLWHSALSRPTVRRRVGLSVDSLTVGRLYIPGHQAGSTAAFIVMHVTWMSVIDRCQISLDCSV